ncbi:MAG: MBOAT family protein [Planctomycetes bacterium]|nr:MBOAT family protein [Planctomycetota bacterium]
MLFNSWVFVVFFVVVYVLYLRLGHEGQNRLLLAASFLFYGWWDVRFLGLLILSSSFDWYCGLLLSRTESIPRRKALVAAVVLSNLGILAAFKYCDLFLGSLEAVLRFFGGHPGTLALGVVVPVGVSFYTFQTIGYVVDLYRGDVAPCGSLRDYLLFVSFFPQLVAGPIERASHLLGQVTGRRTLAAPALREALWHLVLGFFLKVCVADNLAPMAEEGFGNPDSSGLMALIGLYAFAFQIYCDFGGYSEIARGLAKLMGFELMENFRMPYFATGPREFWRRWHISLSTWLRDYLYLPLGGNRLGARRTYRNLLLTMLLGGLWHGAQWKFVLWGLYQGTLLMVERALVPEEGRGGAPARRPWTPGRALRTFFFFQLVCVGWLLFRCDAVRQVWELPVRMVTRFGARPSDLQALAVLCLLVAPVLVLDVLRERAGRVGFVFAWPAAARWATCVLLLALVALFGARGGQQFIYFQF